jgi:hypothetical protein
MPKRACQRESSAGGPAPVQRSCCSFVSAGCRESFSEWRKHTQVFIQRAVNILQIFPKNPQRQVLHSERWKYGGQKRKQGGSLAHNVADEHIQQDDEAEGRKHKTGQTGKRSGGLLKL